jgi:hypothetical protein
MPESDGTRCRPTLAELRAQAREHAAQLEAVSFLTVQELAGRWGISEDSVRAIARAELPYLVFGKTRIRRYDPRDVQRFESAQRERP